MNYNGNEYFYITNLQGDIIELVDINGNTVVSYKYDAWGNIVYQTDSAIARANPYRYRGYRYDEETGWYYLNSRYYDPMIGRFINADDPEMAILGDNLYKYCENNPISNADQTGYIGESVLLLFTAKYGMALAGWWLKVKLMAFISAIAPYLIWVIAILIVAYITYEIYTQSRAKTNVKTKTLSNVEAKILDGKIYQMAYVQGPALIRFGEKLDFKGAIAALGFNGALNLTQKFIINGDNLPNKIQVLTDTYGVGKFGIYTQNQQAAAALAVVFGCVEPPKVHNPGYYGHYHDRNHIFHVWYGNPLFYN